MDPATTMVLVLSVGVLALLVWFEINSRRNEARKKQASSAGQSGVANVGRQKADEAEAEIDKTKAA